MSGADTHDDSYFASFTDMLVGIIFIFIILLIVVSQNFQNAVDSVTKINQSRNAVLTQIERSLQEAGVPVTVDLDQGVLRLPEDILFGVNAYTVNAKGVQALHTLATVLGQYLPCLAVSDNGPSQVCDALKLSNTDGLDAVFIEGHTDATGQEEHNWLLSAQRAISVFRELTAAEPLLNTGIKNTLGVPVLSVSGYAARRPANAADAGNNTLNRRIELRFIMRSPTSEDLQKINNAIAQ